MSQRALTSEEKLVLDAADSRTVRGKKLDKEKNNAKSLAKVWVIFFVLAVIFFISLRVSNDTPSPECGSIGTCDCLELFDAIYTAYLLILLFYTGFRVKLGCKSNRVQATRRELKEQSRKIDLSFGIMFQFATAILFYSFVKDWLR